METVDFLGCKINVSNKVLEPRIETEFWVEKAIEVMKTRQNEKSMKVLDLFSGSGCIGITILKTCPEDFQGVDFADISDEALEQIRINLDLNRVSKEKAEIIKSDIFSGLSGKKYDFIFANPPYVAKNRINEVQEEVLKKDPHLALFGGEDGMFYIEKFLRKAKEYLEFEGMIFMEFDPLQKAAIEKILKEEGFKYEFKKDQFCKYRWLEASI